MFKLSCNLVICEDGEPLLIDVEIGPWIIGQSVHFRLQRETQEETSETLQDEVQEEPESPSLWYCQFWATYSP